MSPEGLPGSLNDALYAIDEMATEDGQQRLEEAVAAKQLPLAFDEKSSREDIALQVWLESPELLAEKHNEQRLIRLSSFEYYSNPAPTDRTATLEKPHAATLDALTAALAWGTDFAVRRLRRVTGGWGGCENLHDQHAALSRQRVGCPCGRFVWARVG